MSGGYQRLGELLISKGLLDESQLFMGLAIQRTTSRRLGEVLVERGFVTEDQIATCLAEQYGYDLVDPSVVKPTAEALELLEADFALANCVLPIKLSGNELECYVADPVDVEVTDKITRKTGCRLKLAVCSQSSLTVAIWKAYDLSAAEPVIRITG